jgi:2'-5' RNA ligase
MRLFTAIDLPPEVAGRLDGLIAKLRPMARIGWSPTANLHITTKFIGQWQDERLAELQAALAGMGRRAPIPIRVSGLGFFPNRKSPRVFWAGVEAAELTALARDTDSALAKLGVAQESRAYSPHLTLARIKEAPALTLGLRREVELLGQPDFGSFMADRFYLYLSKPGSVYTKLSEFPFTTQ